MQSSTYQAQTFSNGKPYQPEANRIKDDLQALKHDTTTLVQHVAEDAQEKLNEASQAAGEKLSGLKEYSQEQLEKVVAHVKEKPVHAVALAFGAGVLASFLLGRR